MSSHDKLSAAAQDRKSRLAQLKSLKRKQAPVADDNDTDFTSTTDAPTDVARAKSPEDDGTVEVTKTYLSGRNFDPKTRNVKLGFENTPIGDATSTLEYKAEQLALESKLQQEAEKAEDKGLDLFKLQPKRPNWDLKRDLEQKMKSLNVQTDNAIARMVRERVQAQKAAQEKKASNGEGEAVGIEGTELVEAMHLKEQEEERERLRDAEDESEAVS